MFVPTILQGFTPEEKNRIFGYPFAIDKELLNIDKPVLVTGADDKSHLSKLREWLNLPYFISTPVVVEGKVAAILITGRMTESPPFLSRLTHNDMETVQAVSALLGSVLMHQRLDDANKLAQTDALTGLYNRRILEWQSEELLKKELEYGKMSAFIIIDIDYFKAVNDEYGHMAGDKTLKMLAEVLQDQFRATDVIARLGGDEFAVYCTLTADEEPVIDKVAQLIRSWGEMPITVNDGSPFYSTLSIGVAIAPRDGTTYKELLHKSDIALYKSKQQGRNRYTVYNAETMDLEN